MTNQGALCHFSLWMSSAHKPAETGEKPRFFWLIFLSNPKKTLMKQNLSNLMFHKSNSEKYEKECEKLTCKRSRSTWSLSMLLVSSFYVSLCCPRLYISTCLKQLWKQLRVHNWEKTLIRYSDYATVCTLCCQSSIQDCQNKARLFPGGRAFPAEDWTSMLSHSVAVHQKNKSVFSGRRDFQPICLIPLMWLIMSRLWQGNCTALD